MPAKFLMAFRTVNGKLLLRFAPVILLKRLFELPVAPRRGDELVNGEGGIRTPETLASLTVFETAAFDHSATSPANFVRSPRNKSLTDDLRF